MKETEQTTLAVSVLYYLDAGQCLGQDIRIFVI